MGADSYRVALPKKYETVSIRGPGVSLGNEVSELCIPRSAAATV